MNFFGHAAVASWSSSASGVALGAMLPDFASMSGARIASTGDPDVATGIDLHHATDAAFHTLPVVTGLMRELDQRLDRGGCARGPRRAVAHIGVELLLDGVLLDDQSYRDSYTRGLAHDVTMTWRNAGDDELFARLLVRLRAHGIPDDLRRTDAIVHRLHRMLAHRPLLAPSADDLRAISVALAEHRSRVVVASDTVMRMMKATL